MKTALFVYEVPQTESIATFLETVDPDTIDVIACGADVEFALDAKQVRYVSARTFRPTATLNRLTTAKELGHNLLQSPSMAFFSYKDIHIGNLFKPAVQFYLGDFLYALDMVSSVLEQPYEQVYVYTTTHREAPAGAVFGRFTPRIFPDAVALVCRQRGVAYTEVPTGVEGGGVREQFAVYVFMLKRALFGVAMHLLNLFVRLRVRRKKIRILASELWKNIEHLMPALSEGELLLLDRTESLSIGMSSILRNRMQFVHSLDFTTAVTHRMARREAARFKQEWEQMSASYTILTQARFKEYDLSPVLSSVMNHVLHTSERAVKELEGTWNMLESLRPDVVLVRAGSSGQIHFAILCEVARKLHIPSLEIQHGIFSTFSGDFTSDPSSEYIAGYGPLVREELTKKQFAPRSTFLDIGSPHFDVYRDTQKIRRYKEDGHFHIAFVCPPFIPGGWNDSYDVVDYFETVAEATKHIPNVHVTVKLRANPLNESFFCSASERIFSEVPHTIETSKPLSEILPQSDAVISFHSTAFIEALLVEKPLIIAATLSLYIALAEADLEVYENEKTLIVARSSEELKQELSLLAENVSEYQTFSTREHDFMQKHYLLSDGKSSERLADAIRSLAKNH